ncbi:MAG TPA: cation:proton antiporter [Blastocatellia bacterium]|nr:cation:proton antiporter [Blastocatellia bacterium]
MSNHELSIQFFLQLAVILGAIRLVGRAARLVGQPQVVGEMIAGVLLGPSLFGWLLPELHAGLVPPASKPIIYAVSQIGVVLYMFVVGTELQVDLIRSRMRSALAVSASGIVVPFALGGLLAWFLMRDYQFFARGVGLREAALFLGAAMAITAFPMLARIIHERGLAGTSLGTLTLAAGAMDDAAAWSLLAIVLASFGGDGAMVWVAIGGAALYAVVVLQIGRPLLARLEAGARREDRVTGPMLGFVLMLLMLAAWYTDYIGIHAVFGAFLLGTAMPRGVVTRDLQRLLEPVTTSFLLPLFFVYSGLNTELGLVVTPACGWLTAVVVLVACVGKGVGCWLAARASGETNQQAMAIGALMNARGMMELIMLNIGLERGIITPTLFTILVIMAVVTTLMTSPLFELIWRGRPTPALPRAWRVAAGN